MTIVECWLMQMFHASIFGIFNDAFVVDSLFVPILEICLPLANYLIVVVVVVCRLFIRSFVRSFFLLLVLCYSHYNYGNKNVTRKFQFEETRNEKTYRHVETCEINIYNRRH